MSQVNLLGNQAWPDATINATVTAIIRQSYSADDELKASRLARKETRTPQEDAYIAAVDAAVEAALVQGAVIRADAALLDSVIAYEAAFDRLDEPLVTDLATEAVEQDEIERAAAQAVLDNANADVIRLFAERNPPETTQGDI